MAIAAAAAAKKAFETSRASVMGVPQEPWMSTAAADPPSPLRGGGAIEQNPDIRYLGRLLGDVIRETPAPHGGPALFERIEHIRQS